MTYRKITLTSLDLAYIHILYLEIYCRTTTKLYGRVEERQNNYFQFSRWRWQWFVNVKSSPSIVWGETEREWESKISATVSVVGRPCGATIYIKKLFFPLKKNYTRIYCIYIYNGIMVHYIIYHVLYYICRYFPFSFNRFISSPLS